MRTSRRTGVTLDGVAYRLYVPPKGKPEGSESWDSAVSNFPIQVKDVETVQNDWSGGFGYSRLGGNTPKNGYAWTQPGYCRDPFLFCPPGRIEELTMPVNTRTASATAISRAPIAGRDWQNADGSTDFFFTCGEYICVDAHGAGAINDIYYGGTPGGNHAVQYVSAELFDDAANGTAIFFGLYWNNAIGAPYNSIVKYNAAGFSRAGANYVSAGMMKVAHMAPGGRLTGGLLTSSMNAGEGADYLIVNDTSQTAGTANSLKACPKGQDPLNINNYATWANIGHKKYNVARLVGSRQHCYVVKPDGVFDFDELGNSWPLTSWWNDVIDLNNGGCASYWDGGIITSHRMGVNWISVSDSTPRQDKPEWVTPGYKTGNETPIFGQMTAICEGAGWIYGAMNNGSNSYIMAGTPDPNSPSRILWHGAEAYLEGVAVTMICISNASGRPMLYYGGLDAADGITPRLFRQYMAKGAGPLQDLLYGSSGFQFNETASLYMPTNTWNYPGADKLIQAFDIQADGLTADSFAEVFAAVNLEHAYDTTGYISQGAIAFSPGGTVYSDDGTGTATTGGGFLMGRHLNTRIDLHGPFNAPVRLRNLMTTAAIKVRTSAERLLTFEITKAMPANDCGLDRSDMNFAYAHLVSLQDSHEVTMTDEFSADPLTVMVQSGSVTRGWEPDETGTAFVGVVRCRVRILSSIMYADRTDRADDSSKRAL